MNTHDYEVAVMNVRGAALAANRAIVLGGAEKICTTGTKLFQLAPAIPVAFMVEGTASLMGVPWETIIAAYARQLGDRRFDTLVDYRNGLVNFIEGARLMFPESLQREWLRREVTWYWRLRYGKALDERTEKSSRKIGEESSRELYELIRWFIEWEQKDRRDVAPAARAFADKALATYADVFDEAEKEVFSAVKLPDDIRLGLRMTFCHFVGENTIFGPDDSRLVTAGMGDAEPFPSLLYEGVGTIKLNRLAIGPCNCPETSRISQRRPSVIVPSFWQGGPIDAIIGGIHSGLEFNLASLIRESLSARHRDAETGPIDEGEFPAGRFRELLEAEKAERYSGPFLDAVATLPREEMAALAEALVIVMGLRAQASAKKEQPVTGFIDHALAGAMNVALLSKSEGFIWVKGK